jgi:hypothetical protein
MRPEDENRLACQLPVVSYEEPSHELVLKGHGFSHAANRRHKCGFSR